MSLTYDQKSEIRMAFDEAYVPADRRRSIRVKHQVPAEIVPFKKGRPGAALNVQIEDFSPVGVGMIHSSPLELGSDFLLKVPRAEYNDLLVLLTVARCIKRDDGNWQIGLEITSVLTRPIESLSNDSAEAVGMTQSTKFLMALLAVLGLGLLAAAFLARHN
jgi:c-di-GMP-binding flagellar brake protein YcgR